MRGELTLVDTTVGTRVVLGFLVPAEALRTRLPPPWQPSAAPPPSYAAAFGPAAARAATAPNLLLVFNDLLLNQDSGGRGPGRLLSAGDWPDQPSCEGRSR